MPARQGACGLLLSTGWRLGALRLLGLLLAFVLAFFLCVRLFGSRRRARIPEAGGFLWLRSVHKRRNRSACWCVKPLSTQPETHRTEKQNHTSTARLWHGAVLPACPDKQTETKRDKQKMPRKRRTTKNNQEQPQKIATQRKLLCCRSANASTTHRTETNKSSMVTDVRFDTRQLQIRMIYINAERTTTKNKRVSSNCLRISSSTTPLCDTSQTDHILATCRKRLPSLLTCSECTDEECNMQKNHNHCTRSSEKLARLVFSTRSLRTS